MLWCVAGRLTSLNRALYALVRGWKAYLVEQSLVCFGAWLEGQHQHVVVAM